MPAFVAPSPATSFLRPIHRSLSPSTNPPTRAAPRAPRAVADAPDAPPADLAAAFDSVVMPTYARYPLAMSHGSGAELVTTDGRVFLDCVAGIATCTLGHAHPAIVDAVTRQIARVAHVSNLYYIPEQAALARWLVAHSPADKVFFCNSGAEANEAAIKLARKHWHLRNPSNPPGNPVVITARQSFHGRTLATLTATGQDKYHEYWWPLVPGFEYVTYNDAADLRAVADRVGPNLAAVLLEALQGEGGIHPADHRFFRAARDVCDARAALLMCDEVQVGVGRTGKLWGFEHTPVRPDVFTVAKGLGGGVPIGAMCCTDACNVFTPGDHASTFGGNPLASAAGVAIATQLTEAGVLQNAHERGEQLGAGLKRVADRFPELVKDVRGLGLILGVELHGVAAADVVGKAMENGLLLVPAGKHVVRFVPPLVITEQQIDDVLGMFEKALQSVVSGK